MDFQKITHVYLLGIGGIGMSGLARYFNYLGKKVAGYDKTPSELTIELAAEDILVHYDDDLNQLPSEFLKVEKSCLLLIYTPAIPKQHNELNWFRLNGYIFYKRSEVLGFISKNYKTVAVAGTHGKTTKALLRLIFYTILR